MSTATLMLIVAVICFVLAAVGVPVPRVNLTALGLAFGFGAFLVGGGSL